MSAPSKPDSQPPTPQSQPKSASPQATEIGQMEVSTTFIYYCAGTTMIATFLASQLLHLSLLTPQPYRIGVIFGLVGGILGTYFNHTATFSLTAKNPQALDAQIKTLLTDIGYFLAQQDPDLENTAIPEDSSNEKKAGGNKPSITATPPTLEIYRPSFWRSLTAGPIIIQREPHQLTFISRAQTIKWLRGQLI